jgi:cytochrome c-type biogenesis protein CcmH
MKRRSPRLPACTRAAAISAALLLGAGAQASAAGRPSLPMVERQVMCVTCKIPLNLAESPQADRERAFIQSLIDSGHSESQIKRALVSQYGSSALALPAAHGFSLLVYLVPLAALLALGPVLALLLPRWRRRARSEAIAATPKSLTPADAARLDADMARFD